MLKKSEHQFQFAACIAGLWMFWCLLLPWLAQIPPLREHIGEMKAKNINVGAMFYTELDWQPPSGAAWR
jgi:hypothetical protein